MMLLGTLLPPSSLPDVDTGWSLFSVDTFAHFIMFAVLTFLLIVGLTKQYTYPMLRHSAVKYSLIASTCYGVFIELMQLALSLGREADPMDVVTNSLGCFVGLMLFKWIYVW
ncbi:VanZ family protein [Pontibacter silvestris]|uniref:VanZ family protein n=1 Tax=Pontibacter silvestris TaxID=2305183 RepID=A0ABW4WWK0_9BACT|nr:VanZ family protein [Pontibacter silvestris]MCC9136335.1 VanZ family protein [Pontibacter silvestris]